MSSLENMLAQPARKRGAVSVIDAGGFITYMNRHCEDGTLVYADIDQVSGSFKLVGVINDNSAEEPGWRDHTCTMDRKQSVEWGAGLARTSRRCRKPILPPGSKTTSLTLPLPRACRPAGTCWQCRWGSSTSEKRLKSKVNLQSGSFRLEYIDDEDKDTRTSMEVFSRFSIGIPVFENSTSAYQIDARLKYRESSGKVSFWFELIRPDKAFRQAVEDELGAIAGATGLSIINGKK